MESATSQIRSVIEFLKSEKTRDDALDIIQGLISNTDLHEILLEVGLPKTILRLMEASQDKLKILQVLVNLSSIPCFVNCLLSLNAVVRILRHYLLIKDEDTIGSINVKYDIDSFVIDTESKDSSDETPLLLMILTNLTLNEAGQKQFLGVEQEKTKGVLLVKFMEKFFSGIYFESTNFSSSVLANVSSLKEGRLFILEMGLFAVFLSNYDKLNVFKMLNILRLFRNCCFEYDMHESELLDKNVEN